MQWPMADIYFRKIFKALHQTKQFTQMQIAEMVGIDQRRVSEIILNKRDDKGRLIKQPR